MCIICQNQPDPLHPAAQAALHAAFAAPSLTYPVGPTSAGVIAIAEQLVSDYLVSGDKTDYRKFDVKIGDTLNVNISALTLEGQNHAIRALDIWSRATGLKFDLSPAADAKIDITFDDDQPGAYASYTYGNHVIFGAHVNIATSWIDDYGPGVDTYSLQTYLHEIGHALGLSHAGDYSAGAVPTFAEDSWQMTVMSYIEQKVVSTGGASYAYVMGPMPADLLAIQNLYGVSKLVGAGNTTYGLNSNAGLAQSLIGDLMQDGTLNKAITFTVIDKSGRDTFDFRSDIADQIINLTPGTASNIYNWRENLLIEKTTLIERVFAGLGDDLVLGNTTANLVYGGAGGDSLTGANGADQLFGGTEADLLTGGLARDRLVGGDGVDTLIGGTGIDSMVGGAGFDLFVFTARNQSLPKHMDRIVDFAHGQDTIDLAACDANTTRANDQAFRFIGHRDFSSAGQLRIKVDVGGVTLLGDTDGNGIADFAIRLAGIVQLSAADFIL